MRKDHYSIGISIDIRHDATWELNDVIDNKVAVMCDCSIHVVCAYRGM